MISVSFSRKYFIPVTHDVLIKFAPIKDNEGETKPAGKIRVKTYV